MKLAFIPCEATEWLAEGRLLGRTELSPTADAASQVAAWANVLQQAGVGRILHAPDELATRTAQHLAERLDVPTKSLRALSEVDTGLWTGLTYEQLEARYPSAYRQLCESPLSVQPPEGEELGAAAVRLRGCLRKQLARNGQTSLGLVLRPLAMALLQAAIERTAAAHIWEAAQGPAEPVIIDYQESPGGREDV